MYIHIFRYPNPNPLFLGSQGRDGASAGGISVGRGSAAGLSVKDRSAADSQKNVSAENVISAHKLSNNIH
jgi:hypothetical protein